MNKILIGALCALSLSACERPNTGPAAAGHTHATQNATDSAGHAQGGDHGHARGDEHAHGEGGAAEKLTHYSAQTELFVEFPRLVVGEESAFAAHLTTLADFRALAAGTVTLVLSGGAGPEERFSVDGPSQPGIFRPRATPRHGGERDLAIEVVTPAFSVRHIMGSFTVYADRKSADAAPVAEMADGVAFTKEQQWKVDFATAPAVRRTLRTAVAASGSLTGRPDGEALITAAAAGQIKAAGAFPILGQAVAKGQVLAYLAPRLGGDTDLATLAAQARQARIELELAEQERQRMEVLYREEAIPEKRLLVARGAEDSARARQGAAEARVAQYGGGGGGVPLRAPVGGTLVDVRVTPGAYVQEGAPLFHIADRKALWLQLRVAEVDAARLQSPVGASFQVDGIEESFEVAPGRNGRLVAVGGAVDAVTRTLPVVFEVRQPDERLRIGMAVKGQVLLAAARQAVAVPRSALLDESGVATVFVMRHGEAFERRAIRTGARDGDWIEVVEGLRPGERVVSRGAYLVKLAASRSGDIGHGHVH